jgi:hypothetical protein
MSTSQEKQPQKSDRQDKLECQLRAFEQSAGTPFVPGELEGWIEAALSAFGELGPLFQEHVQKIHSQEFANISQEDPELLARVSEMRLEDAAIDLLQVQIADWLDSLQTRVSTGSNEGECETELKEELDRFVTESLALVVRIRKQELAIRTWVVEAFTRDRGDAD